MCFLGWPRELGRGFLYIQGATANTYSSGFGAPLLKGVIILAFSERVVPGRGSLCKSFVSWLAPRDIAARITDTGDVFKWRGPPGSFPSNEAVRLLCHVMRSPTSCFWFPHSSCRHTNLCTWWFTALVWNHRGDEHHQCGGSRVSFIGFVLRPLLLHFQHKAQILGETLDPSFPTWTSGWRSFYSSCPVSGCVFIALGNSVISVLPITAHIVMGRRTSIFCRIPWHWTL